MKLHNILFLILANLLLLGNLGCSSHQYTVNDYKQECDNNVIGSCNKLGDIYLWGLGVDRNFNLAKKYHEKACEQDNSESCNTLGLWYLDSRAPHIDGVERDFTRAKKYFEKACIEGMYGNACNNLGWLYLNGIAVEKNIDTADMYFRKACDLYHDGDGCHNRAYMYSKGLNGPIDKESEKKYEKAAENCYKEACDKNNGKQCGELTLFYARRNNDQQATIYAKKACDLDNSYGCFVAGYNNEKDYSAIYYYDKACYLGHQTSCNTLGRMYDYGSEITRVNKTLAKSYYKRGCDLVGGDRNWDGYSCEGYEKLSEQGY